MHKDKVPTMKKVLDVIAMLIVLSLVMLAVLALYVVPGLFYFFICGSALVGLCMVITWAILRVAN